MKVGQKNGQKMGKLCKVVCVVLINKKLHSLSADEEKLQSLCMAAIHIHRPLQSLPVATAQSFCTEANVGSRSSKVSLLEFIKNNRSKVEEFN